jgi:hypothetical protein
MIIIIMHTSELLEQRTTSTRDRERESKMAKSPDSQKHGPEKRSGSKITVKIGK